MSANSSLFAQLLQLLPQATFRKIVREEHGERCAKGFTCRMQLVAMLYLQLAQAKSLAEICDGLRLTCGKLSHLGIATAPAKSTLAYANEHRPAVIYQRLFAATLQQAEQWRPGKWTRQGVFFVTRLKDNAVYTVEEERPVPAQHPEIISDQLIRLSSAYAQARCPSRLRRIVVRDTTGEEVVLLTNQFSLAATTIAAIYRDRWAIEIFFRTIKQCLRIKTFVGTSANALAIQIWTALLALLLVAICRFRSTFGWHLSRLLALLRVNLFTYRDLLDWLTDPFHTPPLGPPEQLELAF